ncbi:BREX system P-loop protein BrxC [Sedimenticola selenatireducens]|uniref:BREX system P-loop protein BrxC n=1 Tax=Sedimenticola selenatireducens TaxID=191960 RepID=UPI000491B194|nr:BREX system P-loop protein BrxC [Sedimenticola selenatireducens]
MKNRDIYQRDPGKITLLNNGVATMTDALTDDERRTLRFELEHFVCEGEYQRGLVRILDSYVSNQGQPEQPAAWVSGFFGSGKSHLAKMLRFLWTDYTFPEDGASARGLARLPTDVQDLLKEITTLGKRAHGLHAAAGTLGAGAGDSVRLALLGIAFKSAELPESYPQARFCIWLRKNDIYDQVCAAVEADGRDFRRELNDMYVSPLIAKALLAADPNFATSEKEARAALRAQFPKPKDITTDEFVAVLQETLAPDGETPCAVIILDEVQQYIGDDTSRSYIVQEVVEACSKRFGDRLLFLGTGQTALSGTPALQRLQGRFTVNVELSDTDVETVTRRVVLAKRPDRVNDVKSTMDGNAGELDRHLVGTKIGPRSEDKSVLVEDYPLLPVRRRFWEHALRAVDRAGTAGQLRTQLRIVYDAIRRTADDPVGTVVPADFLFEEISANLLQSGVLLREVNETIVEQDDGTPDGRLKSRLCALVFLIRKLPREAGVDIGVRATADALADLLVKDLAKDGAALRGQLPKLLDELVAAGTLMKLDDEYSLQTRESSEWEAEFRNRQTKLVNDPTRMSSKRAQLLGAAVQDAIGSVKLLHGKCKEPRKLALHFGSEPPQGTAHEIPVWIRDGWGSDEKSVIADARAAGPDSPVIHVFVPKSRADSLARVVAAQSAAKDTLEYKGVPSTPEGIEARQGMETRLTEASNSLRTLVAEVVDGAKVYQGGGSERLEVSLLEKVREAANASLDRLFYDFKDSDDHRWPKVIERARKGAEHPLEALDYSGKTEDHPVCSAVLSFVGSGKKGKDIRSHFSDPPYGWSRDAVDAALISLFGTGHLRATTSGTPFKPGQLDQAKVSSTDFRVESATIDTRQRLKVRKLFQTGAMACKPNEEAAAAGEFLSKLSELARGAGGEAPLPERPDTSHLLDLQSFAGNEQLVGILNRHDELLKNIEDWTKARDLAEKRLPAYKRLLSLARHAEGLDSAKETQPQIEAIAANRSLLDSADPVPDLAKTLADALRAALAGAEKHYAEIFEQESTRLEAAESWQKVEQTERDRILKGLNIVKVSKGATGTEQEVLDSLDRISLDAWRTKTAALPQLFADARIQADKLVEPKTHHVKLGSATLRTPEEVQAWVKKTEQELLEQLKHGPVVVS